MGGFETGPKSACDGTLLNPTFPCVIADRSRDHARMKSKTIHYIFTVECIVTLIMVFAFSVVFFSAPCPAFPSNRIKSIATGPEDCPLLPACPSGPSVPLPPGRGDQGELKFSAPVAGKGKVADGTGDNEGMLFIPAGDFDMGSPEGEGRFDERPRRKVFVKNFYIGKHEVTVKEYCDFLNREGENSRDGVYRVKIDSDFSPLVKQGRRFKPKPGHEDKPMVCVSWNGAADYAQWTGGRLPTSAEWEKAAALTTLSPPKDNPQIPVQEGPVSVNRAQAGVRGMAGLIGNVWEWCSDWYSSDHYGDSKAENPEGPPVGLEKIIRGGSWAAPDSSRRIQNLHKAAPRGYYRTVGFRVVRD